MSNPSTDNSPQEGGSSVPSLQSLMESHTQSLGIHLPCSQRNSFAEHVRDATAHRCIHVLNAGASFAR